MNQVTSISSCLVPLLTSCLYWNDLPLGWSLKDLDTNLKNTISKKDLGRLLKTKKMFQELEERAKTGLLRTHFVAGELFISPIEFMEVAFALKYKPAEKAFLEFEKLPGPLFVLAYGLVCRKKRPNPANASDVSLTLKEKIKTQRKKNRDRCHRMAAKKIYFKEGVAKLAAWAKFDDFFIGSVFRKVTYPIGHRRFAKNPNPMKKARIWVHRSFATPSKSHDFLGLI